MKRVGGERMRVQLIHDFSSDGSINGCGLGLGFDLVFNIGYAHTFSVVIVTSRISTPVDQSRQVVAVVSNVTKVIEHVALFVLQCGRTAYRPYAKPAATDFYL